MRKKDFSEADEAKVQAQIASDPDAPEASDVELAGARPFAEAFPALAESIRRGRGRPASASPRVALTLRIERETIERFKATGKGWQTRMNDALRKAAP